MRRDTTVTRVALVIPIHNRKETTLQCLGSLERIDKAEFEIKIYIVDDGSTDGSSEAIAELFPEVELIPGDGSLHYAAGTNRGIRAALGWQPEYIVTMNDDSVFHEQFLQQLVSTARGNPRAIVGALLLLWNEPHRVFQVGQKWRTFSGGWVFPDDLTAFNVPNTPFEVDCIVGNCVLFPTEAIENNGEMDEARFPLGWGDAQYTVRMRKNGWKLLIDPRALVWCEPNTYPPPLHTLPFRKVLSVLFQDRRHPLNLQRQLVARMESAPTKLLALVAFGVFLASLAGKSLRFAFARLGPKIRIASER